MKKIIIGAVMLAAAVSTFTVTAGVKKATICTTYGDDIYDYQLDQYIDSVIPPSAKRLIVLTQCYGGDCIDNFAGGTNTAVISATSVGQKAKYGGYDDDAANACKPGAGKTGQSVHDAGVAGKDSAETPSTGGGLAPGAVSLEPVTADGAVRSRHVIVYAGMPDAKGRDNAQRDKIKANFAGQTNTTVTTVGGEGPEDGWDKHGWGRGLKDAINEAAAAIEAAPDPSKEQFLLFVTDHGDLHTVEHVTTPMPPSNSVVVHAAAFVAADFEERQFERPGFSITVDIAPFTHAVGDPPDYTPFFPTNAWRLLLTPPLPAQPVLLTAFEERFIEVDDGIIGNAPEEGVRLFFPVDPAFFVDSFFDVTYEVEIFNDTANHYLVLEFSQDTGPVAKGESEPGFVRINEDMLIGESDMMYDGHEIVVDGCVVTIDGVHVFERLTLENNATVTHTPGSMGLVLTVLEDLTVQAGSKIDVSAKGLSEREGTSGRSGGSHGGRGQQVSGGSCAIYGSAEWPVDLGAGGRYTEMGYIGWSRGGGRVQIVANTLELNGALLANGANSSHTYEGGGAGGSILIEAGMLRGDGLIAADGGWKGGGSGSGGGGRVAIYYDDAGGFDLDRVSAAGADGAGAGSVLLKDRAADTAHLKVGNFDRATASDIPTVLNIDSLALGQLTIGAAVRLNLALSQPAPLDGMAVTGAWVSVAGDCYGHDFVLADTDWTQTGVFGFSNLVSLAGASTLRHGAGYEDGLRIHAATVSVASASSINAGAGGRWPFVETTGRSGGSYGGLGEWYVGESCATYGDYWVPSEPGSGGRSGSNASRGGGFIRIEADALNLNGSIQVNGQNGPQYTGGGSGGGVMIDVRHLSGLGSIQANGGLRGADSSYGGGGGGRVAVYYALCDGFDLAAIQSSGAPAGGVGTVYTQDTDEPFGHLSFNNRGFSHNSKIPTVLVIDSNRFDRLSCKGNARVNLTVGEPLLLAELAATDGFVDFTGAMYSSQFAVTNTDWTHSGTFGFSKRVELCGSSTLRHGANYAAGLRIQAEIVAVAAASKIDVSSCGTGPRAETTGRSGGSYGGLGQSKYGSASPVYGDAWMPSELGSGGVGPSGRQSVGGGCLYISSEVLTLDGALLANGQNGGQYTGGGSGGAIWIDAGVLSGPGSLQARGGAAGADGGGAGGGGRVAVYAQNVVEFCPSAVESKANAGAGWGTVFLGVPRTVAVTVAGQGSCMPSGAVIIPYGGIHPFTFSSMPLSLKTNGTEIATAPTFEWVNSGLWRGTLDDAVWLATLTGSERLEAAFEALQFGNAAVLPGGRMDVSVNGQAGWRYTFERRESLTEGEWLPVPGQTDIICVESGILVLTDDAVLPQAFYRVKAEAL